MLASCEARLAAGGLTTPLFRQNIAALNLPLRYAAAFVAAGSFQLLTDPVAAQKALERIRAHLVDPGLLLLDLFVPAEAEHPPGAPVVEVQTITLSDGTKIARRSEVFVDVDGRRIDIQQPLRAARTRDDHGARGRVAGAHLVLRGRNRHAAARRGLSRCPITEPACAVR